MTSAYLANSILKKCKIPKDQLKIFLSYLNQKPLDEYLIISRIYTDQKKLGKNDSIDLIINSKNNKLNNNGFSVSDANKILNNNLLSCLEIEVIFMETW